MEQKYQPKPDVDGMSPGAENVSAWESESHRIGRKRPLAPRSSAV